jgi:hypothetical protein
MRFSKTGYSSGFYHRFVIIVSLGLVLGLLVAVVCKSSLDDFYLTPEESTTTTIVASTDTSQTKQTVSTTTESSSTYIPEESPTITFGPLVVDVVTNAATFLWSTDQETASQVEYSTDSNFMLGFGARFPANPTNVYAQNHQVRLPNLANGETYYYVVISTNQAGLAVVSDVGTFTTVEILVGDTAPPEFILGPTEVSLIGTTITWEWLASERSTAEVEYSTEEGFELGEGTRFVADAGTTDYEHSLTLSGLEPYTVYYYHLLSSDAIGNLADTGELTFQTQMLDHRYGWVGNGASCSPSPCWATAGNPAEGCTNRSMKTPRGLEIDSNGNVYVADTGNQRIQKFQANAYWEGWVGEYDNNTCDGGSPDGQHKTGWSQSGAYARNDMNGVFGAFWNPIKVTVDTNNGYMYVAEATNNRLSRWSASGFAIPNDSWLGGGNTGWNNLATPTGLGDYQFDRPHGVGVDPDPANPDNHIYIADTYNNRVIKYDSSGNFIGCVGGGQEDFATGCDTIDSPEERYFSLPIDVKVSLSGDVLIVDYRNHRICKYSTAGVYQGWVGNGHTTGWELGEASTAGYVDGSFYYPNDISIDLDTGEFYVADRMNHRVQKWEGDGTYVGWLGKGHTTFATGTEQPPQSGTGLGEFNEPEAVAYDYVNERLYVADTDNHRIQRFDF